MAQHLRAFSTILIVEDDEGTRELLTLAITGETPYHTLVMGSGEEVLQRLNEVQAVEPVMMLLDYRLPEMTALDLYDQLCSTVGLENVPTLVLTADRLREDVERIFVERGISVLEKPFDVENLLRHVKNLSRTPPALSRDDALLADCAAESIEG